MFAFVLSMFIAASSMLVGGTIGEFQGYVAAKTNQEVPSVVVRVNDKPVEVGFEITAEEVK